jgi:hypothetical protein
VVDVRKEHPTFAHLETAPRRGTTRAVAAGVRFEVEHWQVVRFIVQVSEDVRELWVFLPFYGVQPDPVGCFPLVLGPYYLPDFFFVVVVR